MWYFSWILGLGLACSFAILNAMWLEVMADDGERPDERDIPPNAKLTCVRDARGSPCYRARVVDQSRQVLTRQFVTAQDHHCSAVAHAAPAVGPFAAVTSEADICRPHQQMVNYSPCSKVSRYVLNSALRRLSFY
jgi:cyd operon protein YbgT